MITIQKQVVAKQLAVPVERRSNFLQLSQKVDYGIFLLLELAKLAEGEQVSLRVISEKNRMSFFFLQKAAFDLRKAGLVQAGRGKNGGYMLAKAAAEITIRNVIEALEGTMALTSCLGHSSACVREGWCTMRGGLSILNQKILETFEQTTLLNLLTTTWKQQ